MFLSPRAYLEVINPITLELRVIFYVRNAVLCASVCVCVCVCVAHVRVLTSGRALLESPLKPCMHMLSLSVARVATCMTKKSCFRSRT